MLGFNMETKRINDLVNIAARTRLDDVKFLELEVQKFLTSPNRRWAMDGDLYYGYEQDILNKRRMVISNDGIMREDKHLPNNRFIDNQYGDMVDQKVNYMLAKPLTFNTENKQYAEALKKVFNKSFHRMLKNCGKDSYNGAVGWVYPYYNEQGELKFKKFRPWEILPYWKDDEHTELDFAVRVYEMETYEGDKEKIITFVDVYDTNGIHKFVYQDNELIPVL